MEKLITGSYVRLKLLAHVVVDYADARFSNLVIKYLAKTIKFTKPF